MISTFVNKIKASIKREIFGERARGEKVIIPDLSKLHRKLDSRLSDRKINEDFNRWCNEMNFGGMHMKKG